MVVQIGYAISGHGFGHATRAIAVMQAIGRKIDAHFTILTSVPAWLFASSLTTPHTVHAMTTDVGLVQHSAMIEDLNTTLTALEHLYPLDNGLIEQAEMLLNQCALVLCDIAPLGIAAAKRAGIPSILVENFTWDWIYQGYLERCPELQPQIDYLRALFKEADFHVQATPICSPCPCDLQVEPVARGLQAPERIRQRVFCQPEQRLVVLTMGGVQTAQQQALDFSALLKRFNAVFVLTGLSREDEFTNNLRFLAQDGPWYFPDLVAAADLVVGKSGYSTVAEAYQGQTAYGYVKRPQFRESAVLEAFLDRSLISCEIAESALADGTWLDQLDRLPATKEILLRPENGADQIAEFVLQLSQGKPECRIYR
nr:glycosyltransferase family protein [uncultured Desulfobulbus sp.]